MKGFSTTLIQVSSWAKCWYAQGNCPFRVIGACIGYRWVDCFIFIMWVMGRWQMRYSSRRSWPVWRWILKWPLNSRNGYTRYFISQTPRLLNMIYTLVKLVGWIQEESIWRTQRQVSVVWNGYQISSCLTRQECHGWYKPRLQLGFKTSMTWWY